MSNPLAIAMKGKGFLPMLARGKVIANRYGLTAGKMDQALGALERTVRQFGCSATLPVTSTALDSSLAVAQKYHRKGIELAIHGLRHIDYSALDYDQQVLHLRQSLQIFERAAIPVSGFRCPYLRWNMDTIRALSTVGLTYDSSQGVALDVVGSGETEGYRHVLGFYRAQPAKELLALPRLVGGLVQIPYCLPDDESLVERLQLSNGAMIETWLAMLDATYESGELFTLGLHPERVPQCHDALVAVLQKARGLSPRVWIARLDEIAAWYLDLGHTVFEHQRDADNLIHAHISAPAGATILARGLSIRQAVRPWSQVYSLVSGEDVVIESEQLPWIGLSPDSPAALERFLRHLGFLTERSANPEAYTCYLDRGAFESADERPLLQSLEQADFPLLRLSRWPDAARSALSITGDVDAFTLWDYGRRIYGK